MNIEELAARCGGLAWISSELFVLEGRWAPLVTDARFAGHLAEASRHHGWHAELWRSCLPDSPALDADARIVAPPGWAEPIASAAGATSDRERARVLGLELLPRLMVAIDDLASLDGPGDRAAARIAKIVAADVLADFLGCQRAALAP